MRSFTLVAQSLCMVFILAASPAVEEDPAKTYAIYATPIIGFVYGVGEMGQGLYSWFTSQQVPASDSKADAGDATAPPLPIEYLLPNLDRGTGNSFAAGTGVVVGVDAGGNFVTESIENIEVGDVVLATDEFNPEAPPEYKLVTGVSSRTVYEYTEVQYKDENDQLETIQATDNHEFFVVGIGWVDAEDLLVGQELVLANGERATVEAVTPVDVALGMAVFNLTVTDGATYYVDGTEAGVDAVAVHNVRFAGRAPSLKGNAGVSRALDRIAKRSKNYTAVASEVTIKVTTLTGKTVRVRVDLVLRNSKTGEILLLEVKNGPFARLTKNQKVAIPAVNKIKSVELRTDKLKNVKDVLLKRGDILTVQKFIKFKYT